jgi:TonB family protein
MNARRRQLLHALVAVAGASFLTLAVVCVMAALNRPPAAKAEEIEPIRCTLIRQSTPPADSEPQRPSEPSPSPAEPQTMAVDLDAPPPQMLVVDPIDVSATLPSPQVDAIQVLVRKPAIAANSQTSSNSPQQFTSARPASNRDAIDSPNDAIPNADQVDEPPRELPGNVEPHYPDREERLGIEGTVVVGLLIDERGRVQDVRFHSGGEAFRRAVLAVVRSWRVTPPRHNGRAIKVWATKEFSFTDPRKRR